MIVSVDFACVMGTSSPQQSLSYLNPSGGPHVAEPAHVRVDLIARSEYFRCAPRVPARSGSQTAMAAGDNQMVMSPRRTRARS